MLIDEELNLLLKRLASNRWLSSDNQFLLIHLLAVEVVLQETVI